MTEPAEKNHTVLVADADASTRSRVQRTLRDHGHKVTTCANGAEAWTLLTTGQWDLLVLDLGLPGRNGYGIIAECRLSPDLEDMPILALSDSDDDDVYDRALAVGASFCVTKPLRMPLLSHAVWQAFRIQARDLELRRLRKRLAEPAPVR